MYILCTQYACTRNPVRARVTYTWRVYYYNTVLYSAAAIHHLYISDTDLCSARKLTVCENNTICLLRRRDEG